MKDIKLAIDLGTTNIDMCLVDFDGNVISERSIKNRQSLYGSDVINRILTVVRDSKFLKIMKDVVIDDISYSLFDMLKEVSAKETDLSCGCICGNTTMISILLEYDVSSMGYSPFKNALSKSVQTYSKALFGERLNTDFPVALSGCISAFIGGDIISGILYLKNTHNVFNENDISLLIDLGTNGEMVINCHGKMLATSTACGPAFEGSLKKQGIYGSTLIDAIALGLKSGNISCEGILGDTYIDKGIRISNVQITADLLRQILSAKAAIRTGIDYLIKESHVSFDDIDNVYIAGGFGQYLNIDSAIDIGLFPSCLKNKIKVVGNTSLMGAILLLNNIFLLDEMNTYTEDNVFVLQLTDNKNYQDSLISNMCFKRE